ncbi:MAG: hypothetical protein JXJ04_01285 [Spirochaetales bacterium]|nr:hypothetical protein [Spirochaetales bacterium]
MTFDVNAIKTTVDSLDSLLGRVKDKLLNNPDEASEKLADVLNELSKILDFVEKETIRFLEIIFLPEKSNFLECRSVLLSFESGYAALKGYEARGHCHKIGNIYEKYLNRWGNRVLDPVEADEFRSIFENMNTADYDMIHGIASVTQYLKDESQKILSLIDADKINEANAEIKAARLELQATRCNIVEALAQLKLLQSSFIASAQTV